MPSRHQLKAIFVTEDGENFLCLRQFYVNDLRTGQLLDGKLYQGCKFRLQKEEYDGDDEQRLPGK